MMTASIQLNLKPPLNSQNSWPSHKTLCCGMFRVLGAPGSGMRGGGGQGGCSWLNLGGGGGKLENSDGDPLWVWYNRLVTVIVVYVCMYMYIFIHTMCMM